MPGCWHETARTGLCAANEGPYKHNFIADHGNPYYGTKIMKLIFIEPCFYDGIADWLYLFEHFALKSVSEAVVEGMGSKVDKFCDARRHLGIDGYAKGAMILWNAPVTHKCAPFLTAVANRIFKGKQWNFASTDQRHRYLKTDHGQVIDRLGSEHSKFPFLE